MATGPATARQPTVTLVIPNWNGEGHLRACLDSVAALDFDRDRFDVVVVDNNSRDRSLELLARHYPWVRVLPQRENLGFAEAVNVAARASSSDCLALMNNDMRVDPAWLEELVASYAPDEGYPCVAGLILDWEGERIDFADGVVNFHGSATQARFHEPREQVDVVDGRELLFACGGSMLIERSLFLELGGFDPTFFAYFEDVDLGWRLWIAGHKVRLAASAVSFHRHHASGAALPLYQRTLISERNWLLMLIKNVDEPHVWRILSAALLLLNERAALVSESRRVLYDPGRPDAGESENVPRIALARVHAVADVVADLDALLERRKLVQASRRRDDSELFPFFNRPLAPVRGESEYLEALVRVTQALRLVDLFPERRATRLLVVSFEADDARLRELARAAARVLSVTYASSQSAQPASEGIEFVKLSSPVLSRQLAAEVDFVLGSAGEAGLAAVASDFHGLLLVDSGGGVVDELLTSADVVLCSTEAAHRRAIDAVERAGTLDAAPAVELVAAGDETAFFRRLANEPWRWRRASGRQGRAAVPEDALALLASWRSEYGVYRSPSWHVARATWRLLPEPLRIRLRRYLRLRRVLPRRA